MDQYYERGVHGYSVGWMGTLIDILRDGLKCV